MRILLLVALLTFPSLSWSSSCPFSFSTPKALEALKSSKEMTADVETGLQATRRRFEVARDKYSSGDVSAGNIKILEDHGIRHVFPGIKTKPRSSAPESSNTGAGQVH